VTREEAHDLCYRGKSNVAHAAASVGCPIGDLKASFAKYVAARPVDPDTWQGDVEPSWPWR
tara:strand:- start:10494 stop:10676 length:183 start_codon:yes stop_codon:yes gene_type:complete